MFKFCKSGKNIYDKYFFGGFTMTQLPLPPRAAGQGDSALWSYLYQLVEQLNTILAQLPHT